MHFFFEAGGQGWGWVGFGLPAFLTRVQDSGRGCKVKAAETKRRSLSVVHLHSSRFVFFLLPSSFIVIAYSLDHRPQVLVSKQGACCWSGPESKVPQLLPRHACIRHCIIYFDVREPDSRTYKAYVEINGKIPTCIKNTMTCDNTMACCKKKHPESGPLGRTPEYSSYIPSV